ncbi:MAG TPA: hypothetical protein VNW99_13240 [Cytophagaceae bacterium]|nr:hypothetical protein [Cytophagaceae bacterium]
MKLSIALFLIFSFNKSFSQHSFPDVYCNGGKIANDHVSGYFTPLQFEFKFQSADSSYIIKEGKIFYILPSSKDSFAINSNKVYSDVLTIVDSIIIVLSRIDVFKNGQLIRTDSAVKIKRLKFNHHQILSPTEDHIINDNDAIIYIDGSAFDFNQPLTRKYKTYWQIALKKNDDDDDDNKERSRAEAKKWDLLLVRGNKPISRLMSDGLTCEVKDIWKLAKRGDFIRLTIKVKGLPQRYLYKVIFIQ